MLMPDESLFRMKPLDNIDFGLQDSDPMNWVSQPFSDSISIEQGRNAPEERPEFDDMDLDLDLSLDDGPSIERGRNQPAPRSLKDDLIGDEIRFQDDDDLQLDLRDEEPSRTNFDTAEPLMPVDGNVGNNDGGMMIQDDTENFAFPIEETAPLNAPPSDPRLQRDSQSPLSSARSSVVRNFDATNLSHEEGEEEEAASMHYTQKAKKRRLIQADTDTVIPSSQIKQQQADRSAILKPASFLSRDPTLLALMNMQRTGGFVSSIMGDGRAKGWAPELRGILSIEVVRQSGQLKRKRDSGVADLEEEDAQALASTNKLPQLDLPTSEDDFAAPIDEAVAGLGNESSLHDPSTIFDLPAAADNNGFIPQPEDEDRQQQPTSNDDDENAPLLDDPFDDTTAPLLHPLSQGPISLGTQHAVHLLRARFGPATDTNSSPRKANILFQAMLPEATTSKADATKMFFEVLVLATKDAVKVEQGEGDLGAGIRIRGKRGLWGEWAEREAGGEIAEEVGVV